MLLCFHLWKSLALLLWIAVCCARCAPVQNMCIHCALPCNEARDLKKYQSVIVLVEQQETLHNVSSLYEGGRCSVPGCFRRDALYAVKIYAGDDDDDEGVLEPLYDRTDLQPDCDPEATSVRINGADWSLSSKLLILPMFCLYILLYSD